MIGLSYITCSDPRNDVPTDALIDLMEIDERVELGIQCDEYSMKKGTPRHEWFEELLKKTDEKFVEPNLALHINGAWCTDFCNGKIPPEIRGWLAAYNNTTFIQPIRRVQLNIGFNLNEISPEGVADAIVFGGGREFIFPLNDDTEPFIRKLYEKTFRFSLLFDASYGAGMSPKKWERPIFYNIPHGYAGGLSPENVAENLAKISKAAGGWVKDDLIWIDAEGQLMKPNSRHFDVDRASAYINAALEFVKKNEGR